MSVLALTLLTVWLRRVAPPDDVSAARPSAGHPGSASAQAPSPAVERLKVKVLATRPHDPEAYTQGLLWHDGRLFESTGLYGHSSLREVKPETGEVVRSTPLPAKYFGEGLALVDDRLIQITWQEGTAFVYGLAKFVGGWRTTASG
jgi:glutamine cyclotransferase